MKVLMSIKPKYAEKIFSGEKKFEYRKKIWKQEDVDTVVLYVSIPFGQICGEFKISSIMSTDPETLWVFTHSKGGVSMDEYIKYFAGANMAHAISIGEVNRYETRRQLIDYGIKRPPQNFMYLKENLCPK